MDMQRLLGCGIDKGTFDRKFKELSEDDQQKLDRVARRLLMTLKIHYEVNFYQFNITETRDDYYQFLFTELPSLEIYLLCTCLDTLAGKAKYMKFDKWLDDRRIGWVDKQSIGELYCDYEKEYGVGINIQHLFESLHPIAKKWLVDNVRIQRPTQIEISLEKDTNKFIVRLYKYFYNIWRNPFTHSSVSRNALTLETLDGLSEFIPFGEWVLAAKDVEIYNDERKWNLYHKKDIDLSVILRVIIYVTTLAILRIDFTEGLLLSILKKLMRRHASYSFLHEVRENHETLLSWTLKDNVMDLILFKAISNSKIRCLSIAASTRMVGLYEPDGHESKLKQETQKYLALVEGINAQISEFNRINPPRDDANPFERQLIKQQFLQVLMNTEVYKMLLEQPCRFEDIVHIISNP